MVRVLIAASHPLQCTGYARVGCALANGLAERGFDVIYFGYQNLAPNASREIHPLVTVLDVGEITKDPWGFGESILLKTVDDHKIDVVVLYNDVMVVNRFIEALTSNVKIITYLDLVHDNEDFGLITNIDQRSSTIWVFADHWKTHLAKSYGIPTKKVHVLPHGIDACFFPVNQEKARMRLGLPLDGLILLNTNRNSYRKALDLTIRVFLEFYASSKKDVYLFLNNNANTPSGYDIPGLIQHECRRLGLDADHVMTRHILGMPNSGFLSDETLNLLYNACDIGINTCVGEGFGLCNLEHASIGRPQLVNGVGGLKSIFSGNRGGVLVKPIASLALCRGFCAHGGTMEIPDTAAMRDVLKEWYVTPSIAVALTKFDVTRFGWKRILDAAAASIEKCARIK
jgi:glycosyltransferase involved in cell wall biosynthesis